MEHSQRVVFHAALAELSQLDKSDLQAALRKILSVDAERLGVGRVSYWELVADHSAIQCRVLCEGLPGAFLEGGELKASDFPAYFREILQSATIVADDAWTDPRTNEFLEVYFKPHDIRSMLDVPVWRRGKLAGVLCHEQVGTPRTWTTDEQHFALGISNMISVALESVERQRAEVGYALIANASNDVLWDWDMKRDIIEWNDALSITFRHRPEHVQSSLQWWLDHVHPDDRARVKQSLANLFESGSSGWCDQYRWIRGDGTLATVIDRGQLVRDASGAPARMVGSMLDITERVEMQARLALSDRMASIGALAAGVAHEINNPLTYLKANLTVALDHLRGPDANPEVVQLLREAEEAADRVRRIVQDLQILSRPREDDVEDLDACTVIDSSINMAWNEIRHRAQLVKDYRPIPLVRINRARLGQVILNVLINAAHAIEDGRVNSNRIEVSTFTGSEGDAVIEIRDTGCGIPAKLLHRTFEPFFTTKPIGVGTGLGLSICHSIVTAAGGRIDLESPRSGGCLVRVVLPAMIVATQPAADEPVIDSSRRKVLLVDDEVMIRRALRRLLEPQHEVVLADSGEWALDSIMSGTHYDVILCDLMMPDMTGMEIYERLIAESSPLAARMVFMTGGAFSQRSREFLDECGRPVISKPIERTALLHAVTIAAAPPG
jgi:PAS domain S-box-containing protein